MASAELFALIFVACLSDAAISRVYVSGSTATGGMNMWIARARAVGVGSGIARARAIDVAYATTASGVLVKKSQQRRSVERRIPTLTTVFSWVAIYSLITSWSTESTTAGFVGSREGERRLPTPPRPVEKIWSQVDGLGIRRSTVIEGRNTHMSGVANGFSASGGGEIVRTWRGPCIARERGLTDVANPSTTGRELVN